MRQLLLLKSFFVLTIFSFGQSSDYRKLIKKADSLYKSKEYMNSGYAYSEAFKSNGWEGTLTDRYNAACSWALANYSDSSFSQLQRIATRENYINYVHISIDPDLNSLHTDRRWKPLLEMIKNNKDKAEATLNKPLASLLDSIFVQDQKYRQQISRIEKKFGWKSKETQDHWKIIHRTDSSNLAKVKTILDEYGWLGPDLVGAQGNSTLFLVIQHSDQATQEKYLPMIREAVKNRKASGADLALLEDRVALGKGKRQVYGSQVSKDLRANKYYVRPLENPENVDKRRSQVGLPPLRDYVSNWGIIWDVEQYKKDLPLIEQREKSKRN